MAFALSRGVKLYYEETGSGAPIVFAHEFGGDLRSWEPQLRFFSHRYRCIAFNARGWPPSDVPQSIEDYSQAHATDDIINLLKHLGIEKAHIVGLSMGGNAALQVALHHADVALSVTIAGVGYGGEADKRAQFEKDTLAFAERFEKLGTKKGIEPYAINPYRVQFLNKDPRGWAEFKQWFEEHSPVGSALTLRGVLMRRPRILELGEELKKLTVPLLVIAGDEDTPCVGPAMFIKQVCRAASVAIVPSTGHTINLEEPDTFNRLVFEFISLVDSGRWRPRDPRSLSASTLTNSAPEEK
jgi:pimeloyl-ACP methyl ester carboxylesterase